LTLTESASPFSSSSPEAAVLLAVAALASAFLWDARRGRNSLDAPRGCSRWRRRSRAGCTEAGGHDGGAADGALCKVQPCGPRGPLDCLVAGRPDAVWSIEEFLKFI
jgi:hypothetical protein